MSKISQILFESSLDKDGFVDEAKVKEILSSNLKELNEVQTLKLYKEKIAKRIFLRTAQLEHAGDISAENVAVLEEKFSKKLGYKIKFTLSKNPNLISGIKITIGDNIWEKSLKSTLDNLYL